MVVREMAMSQPTVTRVKCIELGKRGDFYEVDVAFGGDEYIVHVYAPHGGSPRINKDVDDLPDWWEDCPEVVIEEALAADLGMCNE